MKILVLSAFVLAITGCAYHPQPVSVFGASGSAYTAPALCQALVQCKKAGETTCYYETESQLDVNGTSRDTLYCKEVKK